VKSPENCAGEENVWNFGGKGREEKRRWGRRDPSLILRRWAKHMVRPYGVKCTNMKAEYVISSS
jgi:hypothetical protein